MKSPSEELVEVISPLLVEGKLFLQDDADKYKEKIALGVMKEEDWLMAVENALEKESMK